MTDTCWMWVSGALEHLNGHYESYGAVYTQLSSNTQLGLGSAKQGTKKLWMLQLLFSGFLHLPEFGPIFLSPELQIISLQDSAGLFANRIKYEASKSMFKPIKSLKWKYFVTVIRLSASNIKSEFL